MIDDTDPLISVNDGRRLLGHIYAAGDRFRAEGPDGEDLGTHDLREAARSAIITHNIHSRKERDRG